MLLPLGDDNSRRSITPYVNYALLGLNVLTFLAVQQGGANERAVMAYACVPKEIVTGQDQVTEPQVMEAPVTGQSVEVPGLERTPIPVYLTMVTSMFLHGGVAHLLGNMLFLWIFGDNVEDRLGHLRYAGFYLLSGVLAALAHVLVTVNTGGNDLIPCVGASGAISGVLAGYLVMHPNNVVHVLVARVMTAMPAWAVIGLWFVFQVVMSLGAAGEGSEVGGVAYAAHIGGFLAGLVLIFLLAPFGEATRHRKVRR